MVSVPGMVTIMGIVVILRIFTILQDCYFPKDCIDFEGHVCLIIFDHPRDVDLPRDGDCPSNYGRCGYSQLEQGCKNASNFLTPNIAILSLPNVFLQ